MLGYLTKELQFKYQITIVLTISVLIKINFNLIPDFGKNSHNRTALNTYLVTYTYL
ncbi:hypothetical protein GCM10007390_37240 [Persicitalea jodogahamensis]|uniref:Uncharacterized protein n=1 Tax=Persicitalea jodogahamensis TaxID=402147 RepID=A0A8J3GA04_9BACT|nr:hypothetical protein GCM10007390_37240 [Persicitalea jodogahamensis]